MAEKRNNFRTLIGDLKERYRLDDVGLVVKIILNWMLGGMGRHRPI
jgi:hypothetical protein